MHLGVINANNIFFFFEEPLLINANIQHIFVFFIYTQYLHVEPIVGGELETPTDASLRKLLHKTKCANQLRSTDWPPARSHPLRA